MDATTAFLYGNLEKTIYMNQPPRFVEAGREDCVCHLQKSIYGLKQFPRQWNKRFDSFILAKGFHKNNYDSCVYKKTFATDGYIFVLLYVDDILIASTCKLEIVKLKATLCRVFEMKDLRKARKILGMKLMRDQCRDTLLVTRLHILIR